MLYKKRGSNFNVVYIGMAYKPNGCIRRRLRLHLRSKHKGSKWTHFSIFAVFSNIREEVEELEGILRHIHRKDLRANRLNKQRGFKKLRKVREKLNN